MIVGDAIQRIDGLLAIKSLPETSKPVEPKDNSIAVENVTFAYDNSESNAIDGISLNVKAGETVALVGPSGGGKTTAAGLIARFWDVTSGEIKVGGVNVKDISKKKLNDIVAYVFQDSMLLKTSIYENVQMGKPSASREEVMEALHNAQCDEILAKFPQGADTVIGAKGVYLSGGEQQRIAVARVMLKNAPIIILDEATSSVDPENEDELQRAIEALTHDKTIIMIAHRLKTVRNADQILVLNNAHIVQRGTHAELIQQKGLYADFVSARQEAIGWKLAQ